MKPLLSIIVPNYNHGKFLDKRLTSILEQSFTNWELLVLDDNSYDESKEIIEAFEEKYPNIRVVINTVNSGCPFKQWYKGLTLASGSYVWIAESDDYCEPNIAENLLSILISDDRIGFAYSNSYIINNDGKIMGSTRKWKEVLSKTRWLEPYINDGQSELRYLSKHCYVSNTSACIFKKEALMEVPWQQVIKFKYRGDWKVYLSIAKKWRIAFTPENLNYYRQNSINSKKVVGTIDDYKEIIQNRIYGLRKMAYKPMRIYIEVSEVIMKEIAKQNTLGRLYRLTVVFLYSPLLFFISYYLLIKYGSNYIKNA